MNQETEFSQIRIPSPGTIPGSSGEESATH
jgi:hypothetical protein